MAVLAIPALIASTALSATGSIMAGNEKARQANFESQQYQGQQRQLQIQEQNTRTAADQAETRRREELTSNMETISAIRAGRGVGEASPTGMSIFSALIGNSERDINTERFNYLQKADTTRIAAENAGIASSMAAGKAKYSLLAGYLGAGADIAKGIYTYASPSATKK